jgi:hypothetical protein
MKINFIFGAIMSLLLVSVFAVAESNETEYKKSLNGRFEFRGFTVDEYLDRFHRADPTTELGWKNAEYQAGLYCEWRRVDPQTKWWLGVWNRNKDDCLAFGDNKKSKAVEVSSPVVCYDKEVCTIEKVCGKTCDEYKTLCNGKKICIDWRIDGQYDCTEYIQKYVCDKYEKKCIRGFCWNECVEYHKENTDICKKWESCTNKLGTYFNKETCTTEKVCN